EIVIGGPDISWTGPLTGFTYIRLLVDGTRWLRIDSDPNATDVSAPMAEGHQLPLASTLFVKPEYLEQPHGQPPTVRRLKKWPAHAIFKFRWVNPLTPSGGGVWFYLVITTEDNGHLVLKLWEIQSEFNSRLFYAREVGAPKADSWEDVEFMRLLPH